MFCLPARPNSEPHAPQYDMRTSDGVAYPRMCGDAVPQPNGRVIVLSGQAVSHTAIRGLRGDEPSRDIAGPACNKH